MKMKKGDEVFVIDESDGVPYKCRVKEVETGEYPGLPPPPQADCGPGPEVEAGEDGVAPLPRPAVRHQGVLGWRDAHCHTSVQ